METSTGRRPFDVKVELETEGLVLDSLNQLEAKLAGQLKIPLRSLRRRLLWLLRSEEIAEDALVSQWLAAYHAAMEYAAERAADPPREPQVDEQGPHDAALPVFGA